MSVPPEQFSRISGQVDLPTVEDSLVLIVGVGSVGSQVAEELANSGVGRLRLMDGDLLEEANLVRHALPREYLGWNKAEAMAAYLDDQIPTLDVRALAQYLDESVDDENVDSVIEDCDLIVIATGEDNTQQRIARRALALDIPAVLPSLYSADGGEVFLQRSPRFPCYLCWDEARPGAEPLRGVTALNVDSWGIIQLTVHICIAVLDPGSAYVTLLVAPSDDPRPRQLFIQNRFGLAIEAIDHRPGCPACAVGPARPQSATSSPPSRHEILPAAAISGNFEPQDESKTTSPPTQETVSDDARRLFNMVVAGCIVIGGVLLMNVAQANQRHDEITSGHSAGHYFGEALVAIFAIVLMAGGAFWLLRELVNLITDKNPPYGR